jgi:hypothetical protein
MSTRISPALLRALFVGFLLLLATRASWAQAGPVAPHVYDFLTVTTVEGTTKNTAKLFITPAFQGKMEIQLEDGNSSSLSTKNNFAIMQRNLLVINQELSDLTVAGWELTHVTGTPYQTRYLFRKAKS